ncbi:MAG: hypothetical protein ACI8P0_006428 [Planctomycetaceae bacterium]|jgi:hypothetical protein
MMIANRAPFPVLLLCICIFSPLPLTLAKDRADRQWTISSQPEKLTARLVDGSVGTVRLRLSSDGSLISIKLDELDEGDLTYVKSELRLDVINMTGVWRSESSTYYAFTEGRGDKVYVRMIESPHLTSLEGSLRHKDGKVVSEQWLTVFKNDPIAKTRSGYAECFSTSAGKVRVRFDHVYWDAQGREKKKLRRKVTNAFVRLDYEEIPERILARYFPTPRSIAEKRKAVIKNILLWWFARTAAKSFDPRENWGKAVIHVALMHASEKSLKYALRDALPDLDDEQLESLLNVIHIWLDRPTVRELKEEAMKELITDIIKTNASELSGAAGIVEFIYDVHVARRKGF